MKAVTARLDGGGHQLVGVEIGGRAPAPEAYRALGAQHVEGVGVVLGADHHRPDTGVGGRGHNAQRDLPPVGHQQRSQAPTS